jgi:hypothetical protein
MVHFSKLVCTMEQADNLIKLGIEPISILFLEGLPLVWTKAELDAMIGPKWQKPDLWNTAKMAEKTATNPNYYPVFFPDVCMDFQNGAQAAAAGLIYLLKEGFLSAGEANDRYESIFLYKTETNGNENPDKKYSPD